MLFQSVVSESLSRMNEPKCCDKLFHMAYTFCVEVPLLLERWVQNKKNNVSNGGSVNCKDSDTNTLTGKECAIGCECALIGSMGMC